MYNILKNLQEDRKVWGDTLVRTTVYFSKKSGYARIKFMATTSGEAIDLIMKMEKKGYKECSWLWWFLKSRGIL